MRGMFGAARRGSKAFNSATSGAARQGFQQSRNVAKRALPAGTRRRSIIAGNTVRGRRARGVAVGGVAAGLGVNAAIGPRGTTSGRNGLQGNTIGGGRTGF